MRFRPCIDIHNGKVKQIVGSTLRDAGNHASDNFVSEFDGGYYGALYKEAGLPGGHIILLNPKDSEYYMEDLRQAELALQAFPGGLQIGGGMEPENARKCIDLGATHVIVTSYVFSGGKINLERLQALECAVGREHLVLDVSCRKKTDGKYYIVTDRWQHFTEVELTISTFAWLGEYCDEFLVHGVDVEGKASGIDRELVELLGRWRGQTITYAGGIRSMEDIRQIAEYGGERLDFTVGSALDLFGGNISFEELAGKYHF